MAERAKSRPPIAVQRALRVLSGHVGAWRKLAGLTQSQLADRAGLDRKTVIRIERGDATASTESLLRVLHALGVLDRIVAAVDPYETDVGRLRSDERLPERVRPRGLSSDDD